MFVKIKKLHNNAVVPQYAKAGDAGMDLVATEVIDGYGFSVTYGTGLAMEIPEGFVGLVFPRSSIRKYDLSLTNCVGVIDSGYRGEIQATFRKEAGIPSKRYEVGDKIAQMILERINTFSEVKIVDTHEKTERGEGGFGSTGK